MSLRRVLPASVLALVLVAAVAAPVSAASPDSGVHYTIASATTDLVQGGLWDCGEGQDAAGATLAFALNMGMGQSPIGSGRPIPWTDTDPALSVFGCNGQGWSLFAHSLDVTGQFDSSLLGVDPFHSAWMHITVPLYDDYGAYTGVTMAFNLDWTAVGRAVVIHRRDARAHEVLRTAPAAVRGTVVVTGLDSLGVPIEDGTLTFDAVDNTENTFINWANHVEH